MSTYLDSMLRAVTSDMHSKLRVIHDRDKKLQLKLEKILRSKYPNATLHRFGSSASNLQVTAKADLDMCLLIPGHDDRVQQAANAFTEAQIDLEMTQKMVDHAKKRWKRIRKQLQEQAEQRGPAAFQKVITVGATTVEYSKDFDDEEQQLGSGIRHKGERPIISVPLCYRANSRSDVTLRKPDFANLDTVKRLLPASETIQAVRVEINEMDESVAVKIDYRALWSAMMPVKSHEMNLSIIETQWMEANADVQDAEHKYQESRSRCKLAEKRIQRLKNIVYDISRLLEQCRSSRGKLFSSVTPIARARVAVVRFVDEESGAPCDILVSEKLGLANSHLLRTYASIEPRFHNLALVVKLWASRRSVNRGDRGLLSSYAHVLSIVHYLQAIIDPPLLPDLQDPELVKHYPPSVYHGVDIRFATDGRAKKAISTLGSLSSEANHQKVRTLGSLLLGYFEWMSEQSQLPSHDTTYCVRARGSGNFLLSRSSCSWFRHKENAKQLEKTAEFRFSIEDPFETHDATNPKRRHDVASTLSREGVKTLKQEWRRAVDLINLAYEASDKSQCQALLRELLRPVDSISAVEIAALGEGSPLATPPTSRGKRARPPRAWEANPSPRIGAGLRAKVPTRASKGGGRGEGKKQN